ncbi:uncharacterized protein LOC143819823 [Paroedura picta]|uniref:uncharacterized protein LOC143819823 n=1 Tax=Paroedura picta TaxID=143630 RepID=UPI004056A152
MGGGLFPMVLLAQELPVGVEGTGHIVPDPNCWLPGTLREGGWRAGAWHSTPERGSVKIRDQPEAIGGEAASSGEISSHCSNLSSGSRGGSSVVMRSPAPVVAWNENSEHGFGIQMYKDTNMDLNSPGGPLNTAIFFTISGQLMMQSKSVNWIQAAVMTGSFVLYFVFSVTFGLLCNLCNTPSWSIQMHLNNPTFYLIYLLCAIVALLPRCIIWSARLQYPLMVDTSMYLTCMVHLILQRKSVTMTQAAVITGSIILYFLFSIIFGSPCILCNPPANTYWIMHKQLSSPAFYLVCLLSTIVALLPRFIITFLKWKRRKPIQLNAV